MKLAITGSEGFLARHLRVALRAAGQHQVIPIDHPTFDNDDRLEESLREADAVVHVAGVNREQPEVVEAANVALARRLVEVLTRLDCSVPVLYANSVRAEGDDYYGRGKRVAAELLGEWADKTTNTVVDVRFPNLFGEGGRPHYNSVVATFCHELAAGRKPTVIEDRTIELLHAQEAAGIIIDELAHPGYSHTVVARGTPSSVTGLLDRLSRISEEYDRDRIPPLTERLDLELFNTYRSYLYPHWYPRPLRSNWDPRGNFVEVLQSLEGQSQTSFSTTEPGVTRGNHYHLRKIERFVVVSGKAEIAVRPVLTSTVTRFAVDGTEPVFVDMPTQCTHNITNVGDEPLYTIFWINEIYDSADPDTYPEIVDP